MSRRGFVNLLACLGLFACPFVSSEGSKLPEFDRATILMMKGDHEAALREYDSVVARNPDDRLAPLALMAMANIQLDLREDPTASEILLGRLLADYSESDWAPEAARRKGEILQGREAWSEAGETYQLAVDLAGRSGSVQSGQWINDVTLAAADCFYQADDRGRVVETYERVLSKAPEADVAATALYRLGETFERSGEGEKAAQRFAEILRRYPSTEMFDAALQKRSIIEPYEELTWEPLETYREGRQLANRGELAEALVAVNQILDGPADPTLKECAEYSQIVLETTQAGNFASGLERLESYVDRYPDGQLRERAERQMNENFSPLADLEGRLAREPDNLDALTALGSGYRIRGSNQRAIELLERAVSIRPEDSATHFELGHAYRQAGDGQKAAEHYRVYLDQNPEDAMAMNLIGYSYLAAGDAVNAIPYFERYVEISPEEANAYDSLGEGLLEAGRLEESAVSYEKAIALDPSFNNSHFMLGRVYADLGQTEKAIAAYGRFLELVDRGPMAQRARAAVDELQTANPNSGGAE